MTTVRVTFAVLALCLWLSLGARTEAVGFNTGMLYRYPWAYDGSMTRIQGWGGAASHTGALSYAVDWDNATENWLAREQPTVVASGAFR